MGLLHHTSLLTYKQAPADADDDHVPAAAPPRHRLVQAPSADQNKVATDRDSSITPVQLVRHQWVLAGVYLPRAG